MKFLKTLLLAVSLVFVAAAPAVVVTGCATVAKDGAYRGDKVLLNADSSMVASFSVIESFLRYEQQNRATLPVRTTEVADYFRANARKWRDSYFAVRDAYAIAPTPDNRSAMEKALALITAGATQAQLYFK